MQGVNVIARLTKLHENLSFLNEEDQVFVKDMVRQCETGQMPNRYQVLRIVEIPVPGEQPITNPDIWSQGMVSVVYASLEERIWRYMPLEQLFALMWRKSLHFSPLSSMADTTEGQLPPEAFEETKKQLPQNILEAGAGSTPTR